MSESDAAVELSAQDAKLVTLARGARARAMASDGAAVLDDMGRSYAAGSVQLRALKLSAVQAAVAAAVASGSRRLEVAVIVSLSAELSADDRAVLDEVGPVRVLAVDLDGKLPPLPAC